jgi:hypothetical protein
MVIVRTTAAMQPIGQIDGFVWPYTTTLEIVLQRVIFRYLNNNNDLPQPGWSPSSSMQKTRLQDVPRKSWAR